MNANILNLHREELLIIPKFISAILVFLCLGCTKMKENQTKIELQALINVNRKISRKVFKWSYLVLSRFEEYIALQLMFDD